MNIFNRAAQFAIKDSRIFRGNIIVEHAAKESAVRVRQLINLYPKEDGPIQ